MLAEELGVSLRTLYRDMAALSARGVPIRGEPGVGYILEAGHFLPPLSFSEDEMDAITLGLRWVEKRADPDLGRAAEDALATVSAGLFRAAVRRRNKVRIDYVDAQGLSSERMVWPVAWLLWRTFEWWWLGASSAAPFVIFAWTG